jgi:hypothetical protein
MRTVFQAVATNEENFSIGHLRINLIVEPSSNSRPRYRVRIKVQ